MKKPHARAKRLSLRRLMAAYTNASPLAQSTITSGTSSRACITVRDAQYLRFSLEEIQTALYDAGERRIAGETH
jgi:hypothetical protein